MTHFRLLLAAASVLTVAACAGSPSSPIGPSYAVAPSSDAKPGSSAPYTLTFAGDIAGSGTVSGSITGSFGSGTLESSVGGAYTLSIGTVDPGDPTFCTAADLNTISASLGGSGNLVDARAGVLSLSSSQASIDGRTSLVWQLTGIVGSDGRIWSMTGNTTTNAPAFLDAGSNTTSLAITHDNGVIGFNRFVGSTKRKDFTAGCRVSFTLTLVSQ
jgi:hypothetical protein